MKSIPLDDLKIDYLTNKFTLEQLAGKFNCSRDIIKFRLKAMHLNQSSKFPTKLSIIEKSIIYGTVLGDGYMPNKYKNACLSVIHGIKQKEYLEFKANKLIKWLTRSAVHNKGTNFCRFETVCHPVFTEIHHQFYKDGKKVVTQKILENVDELALAIWYMDDGYFSKYKIMTIATHCFSHEEHLLIQKWFWERWNIKISIYKHYEKYYIYVPVKETIKFIKLISPYIVSSLQYKIGGK